MPGPWNLGDQVVKCKQPDAASNNTLPCPSDKAKRQDGQRHSVLPEQPLFLPIRSASSGPLSCLEGKLSQRLKEIGCSMESESSSSPDRGDACRRAAIPSDAESPQSPSDGEVPDPPKPSTPLDIGHGMLMYGKQEHELGMTARSSCSASALEGGPPVAPYASVKPNRGQGLLVDPPLPDQISDESSASSSVASPSTGSGRQKEQTCQEQRPSRQPASSSKKSSSMVQFMLAGLRSARRWPKRRSTNDTGSNEQLANAGMADAAPSCPLIETQPESPKLGSGHLRTESSPCTDCRVADEMPLPTAKGLCTWQSKRDKRSSTKRKPRTPEQRATSAPIECTMKGTILPVERQGSAYWSKCLETPPRSIEPAESSYRADVALSVYSLKGASAMNKITEMAGLGGAYHVGVEILSLEWSFGWTPEGTGVHNVYAGCSEAGAFKERVVLGQTPCSPRAVLDIIGELREAWPGTSYNLLRRNCAHFSMELVQRLKVREFPDWVTSLASLIDWLTRWGEMPNSKALDTPLLVEEVTEVPLGSNSARAAAAVASELDWKEAQKYMLERAADAVRARHRRMQAASARSL